MFGITIKFTKIIYCQLHQLADMQSVKSTSLNQLNHYFKSVKSLLTLHDNLEGDFGSIHTRGNIRFISFMLYRSAIFFDK